jgi:hypothetical protein
VPCAIDHDEVRGLRASEEGRAYETEQHEAGDTGSAHAREPAASRGDRPEPHGERDRFEGPEPAPHAQLGATERRREEARERDPALAAFWDRPGDEPPFPARGMRPVIEMLSRVMGAAGKRGLVHLEMTVDAEGKTTSFKIYEMPDLDTAKYVAAVFNSTKFKPAVCADKPCQMYFPFKVRIVRE